MGEASEPMELVGLFKEPRDVERLTEPRDTWRCKSCGWANVFRRARSRSWHEIETKGAS